MAETAETAFNRPSSGADLVFAPQLLLAEAAKVLLRRRRRSEFSQQELRDIRLSFAWSTK
ncbi:hypothetical protein [Candidatus Accumulibacter aalborgensis]|uniref:hypothetical protein n=1 Tax=Candidatus Accumulibacter aalborgensis TaxID=1860102 RepID=UPI0016471240|nr:hypothetical protein [Candidatus Accumulibacter aalborgensis]